MHCPLRIGLRTQNWRGRPLESVECVVKRIGSTTTSKGLGIRAGLDANEYEKAIKVADDALAAVNRRRSRVHGHWNYIIEPN